VKRAKYRGEREKSEERGEREREREEREKREEREREEREGEKRERGQREREDRERHSRESMVQIFLPASSFIARRHSLGTITALFLVIAAYSLPETALRGGHGGE